MINYLRYLLCWCCWELNWHCGVVALLNINRFYLLKKKLYFVFLFFRVPAHRLVLSASSAYFAAMFTGSLRETKEHEVTLGEVQGDALQILVQYCYTGFMELREETVETLLATACLLQLNAVVTACCNFLARQLHPSNCLGFAFFAEQQSCTTLLRLAKSYTCQHFMQVRKICKTR